LGKQVVQEGLLWEFEKALAPNATVIVQKHPPSLTLMNSLVAYSSGSGSGSEDGGSASDTEDKAISKQQQEEEEKQRVRRRLAKLAATQKRKRQEKGKEGTKKAEDGSKTNSIALPSMDELEESTGVPDFVKRKRHLPEAQSFNRDKKDGKEDTVQHKTITEGENCGNCAKYHTIGSSLVICTRCHATKYCNLGCQLNHITEHQKQCKWLQQHGVMMVEVPAGPCRTGRRASHLGTAGEGKY
jgi:hypothetical protein